MFPLWSMVIPHISPTPGTLYSLKVSVLGLNRPSLLAFDSVNQTIPFRSTVKARGAELGVGTGYSSMYRGKEVSPWVKCWATAVLHTAAITITRIQAAARG